MYNSCLSIHCMFISHSLCTQDSYPHPSKSVDEIAASLCPIKHSLWVSAAMSPRFIFIWACVCASCDSYSQGSCQHYHTSRTDGVKESNFLTCMHVSVKRFNLYFIAIKKKEKPLPYVQWASVLSLQLYMCSLDTVYMQGCSRVLSTHPHIYINHMRKFIMFPVFASDLKHKICPLRLKCLA